MFAARRTLWPACGTAAVVGLCPRRAWLAPRWAPQHLGRVRVRFGFTMATGKLAANLADAWFGFASRWELDFTKQRRCPRCIARDADGNPVLDTVVKDGREVQVPRVRIRMLVVGGTGHMKGQTRRLHGSKASAVRAMRGSRSVPAVGLGARCSPTSLVHFRARAMRSKHACAAS